MGHVQWSLPSVLNEIKLRRTWSLDIQALSLHVNMPMTTTTTTPLRVISNNTADKLC